MVRLLYFAWVRERIGLAAEEIALARPLPLAELLDLVAGRSDGHAAALADRGRIRAAINQQFAHPDATVAPGDELAIFPPVTGG
jgi:molybdopterin converting factor subunit 1